MAAVTWIDYAILSFFFGCGLTALVLHLLVRRLYREGMALDAEIRLLGASEKVDDR